MIRIIEPSNENEFELVLIDFNAAVTGLTGLSSVTGLLDWSAPETRQETFYTNAVDMWSAGCILYFMITQEQPFSSHEQIQSGIYSRSHESWTGSSFLVKDLIENLLKVDPSKRYTVK